MRPTITILLLALSGLAVSGPVDMYPVKGQDNEGNYIEFPRSTPFFTDFAETDANVNVSFQTWEIHKMRIETSRCKNPNQMYVIAVDLNTKKRNVYTVDSLVRLPCP